MVRSGVFHAEQFPRDKYPHKKKLQMLLLLNSNAIKQISGNKRRKAINMTHVLNKCEIQLNKSRQRNYRLVSNAQMF